MWPKKAKKTPLLSWSLSKGQSSLSSDRKLSTRLNVRKRERERDYFDPPINNWLGQRQHKRSWHWSQNVQYGWIPVAPCLGQKTELQLEDLPFQGKAWILPWLRVDQDKEVRILYIDINHAVAIPDGHQDRTGWFHWKGSQTNELVETGNVHEALETIRCHCITPLTCQKLVWSPPCIKTSWYPPAKHGTHLCGEGVQGGISGLPRGGRSVTKGIMHPSLRTFPSWGSAPKLCQTTTEAWGLKNQLQLVLWVFLLEHEPWSLVRGSGSGRTRRCLGWYFMQNFGCKTLVQD